MSSNLPMVQANLNWHLKSDFQKILTDLGIDHAHGLNLSVAGVFEKDVQKWGDWIRLNGHAQMHFMEKNAQARSDPSHILDRVKSAIVCLIPYAVGHKVRGSLRTPRDDDPSGLEAVPENLSTDLALPKIAKYARGKDYHKTISKLLSRASESFVSKGLVGGGEGFRAVVDSIPFFDRAAARESGLGFIGKNTMLIRPGMGSYFFVATLLTTIPIEHIADPKPLNSLSTLSCGDCDLCARACPTGALNKDYFLDANNCISYFTIESRGTLPLENWTHLKDTVFGCDICQDVCPYNLKTLDLRKVTPIINTHEPLINLNVSHIASMDQHQYEMWFGGSAMTRAKYEGLVRNAIIHLHETDPNLSINIALKRIDDLNSVIKETCRQILSQGHFLDSFK